MVGAKESWHLISNVNQGRIFILLAGLLWSLAGIFIKSLALPAVVIVFYRSLFASLFFLLFLRKRRGEASSHLFISVASYTAAISLFVFSNKLTTAANAIVLQYTAPLFVFLFIRLLFREPITKGNLVTLLLSMVGVAIIFTGSSGGQDLWGVSVAVLSGFLFAIYMMNLRFLAGFDPLALTFINNLVCSIALLPLIVPHSTPFGGAASGSSCNGGSPVGGSLLPLFQRSREASPSGSLSHCTHRTSAQSHLGGVGSG